MLQKNSFKNPNIPLETHDNVEDTGQPTFPEDENINCPKCKKMLWVSELEENLQVCYHCQHHFRVDVRTRINMLIDEGTFVEYYANMKSTNILDFPDYESKLEKAKATSGEAEAVLCGVGKVNDKKVAIFVMDPLFMIGSMGTVVGEKITRIFELAKEEGLPVIGVTVSGGARMQEGILSLMQMAKTSAAVKRHSDAGLLYITLLTDPTSGGVTASFAMEGDIIISEPGAFIGFAGPRIIEQTTRQTLPEGFQRAEFLIDKGFIDDIVDRKDLKSYLDRVLLLHEVEVD